MDVSELEHLTRDTQHLKHLSFLDVSFQLEEFLEWKKFVINLSPGVEELRMMGINECLQHHDMESIELFGENSLKLLDFRHNFLRSLPPIRVHNPNSKYGLSIDLRHNALEFIGPSAFSTSIQRGLKLESLLLGYNNLGKMFETHTGKMFDHPINLTELDLSHNEITRLSETVFEKLSNLEILNLSQNSLDSISFRFSHMTKLRHIDLADNKISRLNWDTITDLISLSQGQHNLTVNLRGNVFECSCQTWTSLQWMLDNNATFSDFQHYFCFENDTKVSFDNLASLLERLQLQCFAKSSENYECRALAPIAAIILLSVLINLAFVIIAIVCAKKYGICLEKCATYNDLPPGFDSDL